MQDLTFDPVVHSPENERRAGSGGLVSFKTITDLKGSGSIFEHSEKQSDADPFNSAIAPISSAAAWVAVVAEVAELSDGHSDLLEVTTLSSFADSFYA